MPHSETVERILDTAELLFAEQGFAEASLRLITSRAGVNLAAVNYHFGSKKALIQAVFSRFLGPFCMALERELGSRPTHGMTVESLLEVLLKQAMNIRSRHREDLSVFMRLLGRVFSEHHQELRAYLETLYGRVFRHYVRLLQAALPQLSPEELFWRLNFTLGAAVFTLSDLKTSLSVVEQRFQTTPAPEQVLQMMVSFLAAGLRVSPHPNKNT